MLGVRLLRKSPLNAMRRACHPRRGPGGLKHASLERKACVRARSLRSPCGPRALGRYGQPLLHDYKDRHHEVNARGKELRRVETELGTLVSITLEPDADAGELLFTLMVPRVTLREREEPRPPESAESGGSAA